LLPLHGTRLGRRERLGHPLQGRAIDPLHHEVGAPLARARPTYLHDVVAGQHFRELQLASKHSYVSPVVGEMGQHGIERALALLAFAADEPHFRHSPPPRRRTVRHSPTRIFTPRGGTLAITSASSSSLIIRLHGP